MSGSKVEPAFMRQALTEAAKAATRGEVPVGAVLVLAGEVVARAHNQPIAATDPTAHAEVLVLRAAAKAVGNYRLPGSELYVTLEPCAMCVGAMLQARVARLIFGAPDPKAGAAGGLFQLAADGRLNHRIEVVGGVLEAECAALLKDFFEARRGALRPA